MSLPSNTGYSGSDKDEWGSLAGLPSPAPHHGFLLFFFFFFCCFFDRNERRCWVRQLSLTARGPNGFGPVSGETQSHQSVDTTHSSAHLRNDDACVLSPTKAGCEPVTELSGLRLSAAARQKATAASCSVRQTGSRRDASLCSINSAPAASRKAAACGR